MRDRLARLDAIAGKMNTWLVAVALGLGMLDLTVFVGKGLAAVLP